MSIVSNTAGNTGANRLVQQLANAPAKQVLNKDQSSPVSASSVSSKPDIPASQLASLVSKWSNAKQAVDNLANAPQQISQSRKAFAAEMLKRIKEQIRIMMMLTGGDPKTRARQIAVLARELAAAAREYAAASGDTFRISEASAAGVQNENTSTTEQSISAGAEANATGATAGATQVTAQPDLHVGQAAPDSTPATTSNAQEPTPYQPTSTHQVYEQLANKTSEYSRESSASKEDQEFALEVRKLAAQLKALAKQNEVRAHKDSDQSTKRETADTNEALREVEHSLAIIESPNVTYTPSINIVAG
jgi:hypothetical protein